MKENRSSRIISFIAVVLLLLAIGGCGTGADTEGDETEIITVQRGSLVTSITAIGSTLPRAEVALVFQVSGVVSEILVGTGDRVEEGQALISLDAAELQLQVQSAEASVAAAQAQLDQLQGGPRPEEIEIAEAQVRAAGSAVWQAAAQRDQLGSGALDAEVAAAQAQLAAALAEERVAREAHDSTMRCETISLPSGEEEEICPALGTLEEQARFALAAAQEAVAASQLRLAALQGSVESQLAGVDAAVGAAVAQRDIAQAQLDMLLNGATDAEIALAEANFSQAQVALDSAQLALDKATLRAPFSGVIGQVSVDPGQFVGLQMPVVSIVGDSQFAIEADVDEADISGVEDGQEVLIILDAFPGQVLTGHVATVSPSGSFDVGVVSYRVTITIDPTDLRLRSGLTANVEIVRERREGVLLIPNRAIWIDFETGQAFVEQMAGDEITAVVIEQGIANEEFSEVLSGLEEGDQLVVRSASVRDRFRSIVTAPMIGE
jgi:HlyD family secretion protein